MLLDYLDDLPNELTVKEPFESFENLELWWTGMLKIASHKYILSSVV